MDRFELDRQLQESVEMEKHLLEITLEQLFNEFAVLKNEKRLKKNSQTSHEK